MTKTDEKTMANDIVAEAAAWAREHSSTRCAMMSETCMPGCDKNIACDYRIRVVAFAAGFLHCMIMDGEQHRRCWACAHYNGAEEPGAGICRATQERTCGDKSCFNGNFKAQQWNTTQ